MSSLEFQRQQEDSSVIQSFDSITSNLLLLLLWLLLIVHYCLSPLYLPSLLLALHLPCLSSSIYCHCCNQIIKQMIVSGLDHAPMPCPCLGAVLIIILQTKLKKINICVLSNSHQVIFEENIHNPYICVRSQTIFDIYLLANFHYSNCYCKVF